VSGARLGVAVLLALAGAAAGCKRAQASRYEKDALSFEHLARWEVKKDAQRGEMTPRKPAGMVSQKNDQ
jgi:hypothetical protein